MTATELLTCYHCGTSLAKLTLPLSRLDQCPSCGVDLHVCRMCRHYDPRVAESCTEDDAVEVKDKRKANFCDYFVPSPDAYDPTGIEAQRSAGRELAALFGEDAETKPRKREDATRAAAEALFKK